MISSHSGPSPHKRQHRDTRRSIGNVLIRMGRLAGKFAGAAASTGELRPTAPLASPALPRVAAPIERSQPLIAW